MRTLSRKPWGNMLEALVRLVSLSAKLDSLDRKDFDEGRSKASSSTEHPPFS
jgi:hypothetical protein